MNINTSYANNKNKFYFAGSSWDIPFIRVSLSGDDFPAFSDDFGDIPVVEEEHTSREDKLEFLPEVLNNKIVRNHQSWNFINLLQGQL